MTNLILLIYLFLSPIILLLSIAGALFIWYYCKEVYPNTAEKPQNKIQKIKKYLIEAIGELCFGYVMFISLSFLYFLGQSIYNLITS